MKFGIFYYKHKNLTKNTNIGDYIQSIAVKNMLFSLGVKEEDLVYLDRDDLNVYDGDPIILIMQGWFTSYHCSIPYEPELPSEKINPVFFGFHMSDTDYYKNYWKDYFLKHQEIGCRDPHSRDKLFSIGVKAYISRCLTLTFEKRSLKYKPSKVFLVDVPDNIINIIPQDIIQRSEILTHSSIISKNYQDDFKKAQKILDKYKNEADLIITTRIHCAMPAIAMGIKVILLRKSPSDGDRFSILSDIIKFYCLEDIKSQNDIDWDPPLINIQSIKDEIKETLKTVLKKKLNELNIKHN